MGNPNSKHSAGRAANAALVAVTESIAARLAVKSSEIIYTSGASEANNLAIKGIARTTRHLGRHIISTPLEHASVSGPLTYLQEQGYEIDLVAVCAVDSELGTVQPVGEIAEICVITA